MFLSSPVFMLTEYLKDLQSLVSLDCGTENPSGIKQAQEFLITRFFQDSYWKVEQIYVDPSCAPVFKVTNKTPPYDILLSGHLDTVFPIGTVAKRPFKTDETYAYAPGVSDMKGGILAACYAVTTLPQDIINKLSLCVFFTGDEEIGTPFSKELLQETAKQSKLALIAEPAEQTSSLIIARKGSVSVSMHFQGISAHSGTPEKGESAINEMLYQAAKLSQLQDSTKDISVNVGVIQGGHKINIIPETASLEIECRSYEQKDLDYFYDQIQKAVTNPYNKKIKTTIKPKKRTGFITSPFTPNAKTEQIQDIIKQAATNCNQTITWIRDFGLSDGNIIAKTGCPVIDGFSPSGSHFHSDKERLCLHEIEPRIKLLQETISLLSKQ